MAPARSPGGAGRVRRRGRICEVGRQTPAHRSGVGVRRSRRAERQALSVGRRVHAGRSRDGEHVSGALPGQRYTARMVTKALGPSRSSPPTATVSTTWPGTSGSGRATGIDPTTTLNSRWQAASRATRRGPDTPFDPSEPTEKKRVHRGGSFLCTDQVLFTLHGRHARQGRKQTGTNHVGIRLVKTRKER